MKKVLLTGATGYIGSHTWLALSAAGYEVVGIDDFSNSSADVLQRLAVLMGKAPRFERVDICDVMAMAAVFSRYRPDAVVHFAARKAVGESHSIALEYYRNNVGGLISTCEAMRRHGCMRMVFSSSATVYGRPRALPLREDAELGVTSPYGSTKLMGETILRDIGNADASWQAAVLRYFNPVGAHESGLIGENPCGVPNNLMPYVAQVAAGKLPQLQIFGDDYDTRDGTGIRDYVHVVDLAEGHVAALRYLFDNPGSITVNLGTGHGSTVLELVKAYQDACGAAIPCSVTPRRPGDVDACYADVELARHLLAWEAKRGLLQMCRDSWRFQQWST